MLGNIMSSGLVTTFIHLAHPLAHQPTYHSYYAHTIISGIVTLRFSNIRKGHAGVYTCVAQDMYGNRYTYNVNIQVLDATGECQSMRVDRVHVSLLESTCS